jgi:photosystem II stability/assembly factor-like uncharacterized protein
MEPDDDLRSSAPAAGRIGRAIALMVVSVLAIVIAAIAYVHPQPSVGSSRQPAAAAQEAVPSYQLAAIDFVNPATGWVVAELFNHDFAVLHTTDAGTSWTRQLSGAGGGIGEYARFFDTRSGVVVLLGLHAVMFQTSDGGRTWSRGDLHADGGQVVSADFIDAWHGWLLVQVSNLVRPITEVLYRTVDGGATWLEMGDPVTAPDTAVRAVFADRLHGWLYSLSSAPLAYSTADGGATWHRIALPPPPGGWPAAPVGSSGPEEFFIAARPTAGEGVAATVVPIAPLKGRSSDGATFRGYPPLTVRSFDGGGSVMYVYTTFADVSPYRYTNILSDRGQVIAPNAADQLQLSSLDGGSTWKKADVPLDYGAFGFTDAFDWWWIGSGTWAKSSDGGVTWTGRHPLGVLAPLPGSLQVLDPDHAWFAAMAGTRPMLETTADGGYEWTMVSLPPITP